MSFINSPGAFVGTQVLILGFCRNREEEARLLAFGVQPQHIWQIGREHETFAWMLRFIRERACQILVACDFRIFGKSRAQILNSLRDCEEVGASVRDVTNPGDGFTGSLKRALVAIANARFTTNPRKARRLGALGGTAKGEAAKAERAAILADAIIRRLCVFHKLTLADCAKILGSPFSVSTLKRNYVEA